MKLRQKLTKFRHFQYVRGKKWDAENCLATSNKQNLVNTAYNGPKCNFLKYVITYSKSFEQ